MGEFITLKADDGHELAAYEAAASGSAHGNLVLIQEIFGVNNHVRKVCDQWAESGYRVVAPALFDRVERGVEFGYDEASFDKGREIRGGLSDDDVVHDVKAAADYLGVRTARPGSSAIASADLSPGYHPVDWISLPLPDTTAVASPITQVKTRNARRCSTLAKKITPFQ